MYTQDDLALVDGMNKKRLREACKAAEIKSYSKMTVEQMREALRHHIGRALLAHGPAVMETAFKPVKRTPKEKPAPKPERETRNGVKRPLDPNSKCGQVWAALDELVAKGETDLTTAIHAIGEKRGWNKSNVSCELSAYRKHFGLSANREAHSKQAA